MLWAAGISERAGSSRFPPCPPARERPPEPGKASPEPGKASPARSLPSLFLSPSEAALTPAGPGGEGLNRRQRLFGGRKPGRAPLPPQPAGRAAGRREGGWWGPARGCEGRRGRLSLAREPVPGSAGEGGWSAGRLSRVRGVAW